MSGPLTRPRDGFLLSQEWLRSGAGRGPAPIDHPCESRGLPPLTTRRLVFTTAPALDSCFRRNGCGQGRDAAPRPLTTPAKAGVYRLLLRGASYSPPPWPWIPAFAGMVAVRGGTRPRAHRPPLRKQGSTASYYAARPVFTTAPALDSCFRRNGCGQGRDAAPRPLTTPAKAGVYRLLLCGAPYSPLPRPWIPAFAGMVNGRGWPHAHTARSSLPCSPRARWTRCAGWYVCGLRGISKALPSSRSPTVRIWILG